MSKQNLEVPAKTVETHNLRDWVLKDLVVNLLMPVKSLSDNVELILIQDLMLVWVKITHYLLNLLELSNLPILDLKEKDS